MHTQHNVRMSHTCSWYMSIACLFVCSVYVFVCVPLPHKKGYVRGKVRFVQPPPPMKCKKKYVRKITDQERHIQVHVNCNIHVHVCVHIALCMYIWTDYACVNIRYTDEYIDMHTYKYAYAYTHIHISTCT